MGGYFKYVNDMEIIRKKRLITKSKLAEELGISQPTLLAQYKRVRDGKDIQQAYSTYHKIKNFVEKYEDLL